MMTVVIAIEMWMPRLRRKMRMMQYVLCYVVTCLDLMMMLSDDDVDDDLSLLMAFGELCCC